ncbi:PASTA domain-containing protein [Saccharicrinis sp. FJH62]|uniref:PASTA domain-containing protein n=1 Tax=Saccharicrinis sp. FJH62 TaxID=3344657 RepID=UPI0035D455F4
MSIIRFLTSKVFFKNLIISIILLILILASVFIGLYFYTNHGKSEIVPDLKGMNELQIKRVLDNQNLRYEIIDSIYTDSVPNGTLWEQVPEAGSKVKKHRKLFLIFNASTRKSVAMPDIRDLSLRQAKTVLESAGLKIGDTIYIPSEFRNLVIGQHFEGKEVEPGKPVIEGSRIDVLVANGLSSEKTMLPELKGKFYTDAEKLLTGKGLNIGATILADKDLTEDQDKDSLFVLNQKPTSGSLVNIGSSITLWLTADTLKLLPDTLNTDITK